MKKLIMCTISVFMIFITNIFAEPIEQIQAFIVNFTININNKKINLEDDIVVVNDITYVPLRAISECLGNEVEWDDISKTISINSKQDDCKLFSFKSGNLYGYIDKYGKVIIEPQFEYAGDFSEGLACVGKSKDREWGMSGLSSMIYGYINTAGELVIPYSNDRERDFHNGFVCAWKIDSDICYFMDNQGKDAFGKTYYDMKNFSNGYAAVLVNDTYETPHTKPAEEPQQWTFVNTEGKECGEIYTSVTSFVDGISIVEKDGVEKAVNTSFETVFQSDYILQSYSGNGKYIAKDPKTGKFGVIDDRNNIIIDFKYTYIRYSDSMYKVGIGDSFYGIINQDGDVILEPKLNQRVSDYKSGMAVVNDQKSVIDRKGNVIMKAYQYDVVSPCADNLFRVQKRENDKNYEGYIDKYGNVLIMNEVYR